MKKFIAYLIALLVVFAPLNSSASWKELNFGGATPNLLDEQSAAGTESADFSCENASVIAIKTEYSANNVEATFWLVLKDHNNDVGRVYSTKFTPKNTTENDDIQETGFFHGETKYFPTYRAKFYRVVIESAPTQSGAVSMWGTGISSFDAMHSMLSTFKFHADTGFLNIHDAETHFVPLNLHFKKDSGTSETLGSGGAAAGVVRFDVAAGQGGTFSADDRITLTEGTTREHDVLKVISVSTDTLNVDQPLENTYTSAAVVEITDIDITTDGSSTPVTFSLEPPSNEVWHITTMLLQLEDGPQPGIELFSGIAALTTGVVIRAETSTETVNLIVSRTNGDMKHHFGANEVEFIQKVGGGDWATSVIWHLKEHSGAIVRLDGARGDSLKYIVNDNLTAITDGHIVGQGYLRKK